MHGAAKGITEGDVSSKSSTRPRAQANRFANVLAQRGITKGDRIDLLLGMLANGP
jgi:hypothetical protein